MIEHIFKKCNITKCVTSRGVRAIIALTKSTGYNLINARFVSLHRFDIWSEVLLRHDLQQGLDEPEISQVNVVIKSIIMFLYYTSCARDFVRVREFN